MADYWKRRKLTQDEYNGLKNELPDDELINISDSMSANLALQGVQFGAGGGGGGAPTTASYLTAGNETVALPNSVNMGAIGAADNPNLVVNTPSGGVASFTGVQGIPGTVLVTRPTGEIDFSTTIDTNNNAFEINAGTSDLFLIGENTAIRTGGNLLSDTNVNITKFGGVDINSFTQPVDINSPNITLSNGAGASVLRMSSVMGFNLDTNTLPGEITCPDLTMLTGDGSSVVINSAGTFLQSNTEVGSTSPINEFSNGAGTPKLRIDSFGIEGSTLNAGQNITFSTDSNSANILLSSGNNVSLNATNQVATNSNTTQLNSTVSHTVVTPRATISNGVGTPKFDVRAIGVTLETEGASEDINLTASGTGSKINMSAVGAAHTLTLETAGITAKSPTVKQWNGTGTPTIQTSSTGIDITTSATTQDINISTLDSGSSLNLTGAGGISFTSPSIFINNSTQFILESPFISMSDAGGTPSLLLNGGANLTAGTDADVTITSTGTGNNVLNSASTNTLTAPNTTISNGVDTPSIQVLDSVSGIQINGRTRGVTLSATTGNISTTTSNGNISFSTTVNGNYSVTSNTTIVENAVTSIVNQAPIVRLFNGAGTPTIEALTTGINLTTSGLPIAVNTGTNGNFSVTAAGTGTVALTSAFGTTFTAPAHTITTGGGTPSFIKVQNTLNNIELQATTNPIFMNGGAYTINSVTAAWGSTTSFVLTTPAAVISNGGVTPALSVQSTFASILCSSVGAAITCRTGGNVVDINSNNNQMLITSGTGATLFDSSFIRIANIGTGTGTALVRDASNNLVRDSSSLRYKENVRNLEIDSSKIYNLSAKNFNFKSQPDLDVFGWIAEDTYEVLPEIVNLDENGNPESIRYAQTTVLIIEEMKKLRNLVDSLSAQVLALTNP